jgi:hypothetical protein
MRPCKVRFLEVDWSMGAIPKVFSWHLLLGQGMVKQEVLVTDWTATRTITRS